MSQYVYTCPACGWRGLGLGGAPFSRGRAPEACGRCQRPGLTVTSEAHPRVTRRCRCGTEFLSTSRRQPPECVTCRGQKASARARGRRLKYEWTPERDALLRRQYNPRVKRRTHALSRIFGWPRWVIKRRAHTLGLTRPCPRRDFTSEETAFVEHWTGSRASKWIAKRLHRTEASVILKQKRLHLSRRVRDGYTAMAVSECFGVDHHAVDRWIRAGWLRARRCGTARVGKQGDIFKITDADLKAFVRHHPTAFRLDKVEQSWFLDLVLGAPAVSDTLTHGHQKDDHEAA